MSRSVLVKMVTGDSFRIEVPEDAVVSRTAMRTMALAGMGPEQHLKGEVF